MRHVLVIALALALVVIGGCGLQSTSNTDDQTRWMNEVILASNSLKAERNASFAEIKNAVLAADPQGIAGGMRRYHSVLSDLEMKVKASDPPAACQHIQDAMVGMLDRTAEEVAKLSSAGAVDTRSELVQAEASFQAAQADFQAQIKPIADQKHC